MFDLVIVGGGMIGAAAARHASKSGARVALVGPQEQPRSTWGDRVHGPSVFGAHFDEGRITRKTDPDPVWARLAARSIDRYEEIESEGGVQFFSEVGHLTVALQGSETLSDRAAAARELKVRGWEELEESAICERFPYLRFPPGCAAVYEPYESGHISARKLVRAQVEAARALYKAELVSEKVVAVERIPGGRYTIKLATGRELMSERVLVTAGAFTNSCPLLPVQLDQTPVKTQTIHFELGGEDAARLAHMPSVIFKGPHYWAYILPPIEYPDGTHRLKLGGARLDDSSKKELHGADALVDWYRSGGDPAAAEEMSGYLHELVPGLQPLAVHSDACATCNTPTRRPYIGAVGENLFVATGGNGYAAKSSDEIGRLGAICALGHADGEKWGEDTSLPVSLFEPRFVGDS